MIHSYSVTFILLVKCFCFCYVGCNNKQSIETPTSSSTKALAKNDDTLQALRALGYLDEAITTYKKEDLGAHTYQAQNIAAGLTHLTHTQNCTAELIDAKGDVKQKWQYQPCERWGNSIWTPNGELFAIHNAPPKTKNPENFRAARALLKFDAQSNLLWNLSLPIHHDLDITPFKQIAVLTYTHRIIERFSKTIPVRDHEITLLDLSGKIIEQRSFFDFLDDQQGDFKLQPLPFRNFENGEEIDLWHSNTIEWMHQPALAKQNDLYNLNNVLLCVRNQDLLAIIHWPTKKLQWHWGKGELSGPHDSTVLTNGNILVFDNGLHRQWSRVLELDPRTKKIVWQYQSEPVSKFYSRARGASQRLANSNTLITSSDQARIFEVTSNGKMVWEYINPKLGSDGQPIIIYRARRFVPKLEKNCMYCPTTKIE